MAQTNQQRRNAARHLAKKMYKTATAKLNLDDLSEAIGSIDDAMDLLPLQLTDNKTVKQNLVSALPPKFKSNSTPQEKALVLKLWVDQETGII